MGSFLALLGIYLVVGTVIAVLVHRKKQTQEEYFIGGRRIGGGLSALTYAATTYSAFMMVGLVGLAFKTGVGALIFEISYLVGTMILLSVYGRRIWRLSRERGLVSPMELFANRYGAPTGATGTVVAIVALIPYTSSQVIGLALIFQSFGGFHYLFGVVFAVVIVALWAYIGGLRGVAITDALQGVFMIIVALLGFIWVSDRFGGFALQTFPNEFWTPALFINLTLPWFFFALTNPQVVQRLFIPKDNRAFNRVLLLFGLFGLFYTLVVCLVGFAARYGADAGVFPMVADRDMVIVEILKIMGRWLALPLALSIVFAAVSTSNSIILTLSSMVVRDLFRDRQRTWVGRIFILVLSLLVFLFSLTRPSYIVELSVVSSSILLCFLPLIFGIFHWRRGGVVTGVATVLGGAGAAIALRLFKVPLSSVYTLVAAFAVFFIASMLEKSPMNERASL